MNIHSSFRRILLTLVALAGSGLVLGGEIHDAAVNGDVEKVKVLLKANPELASSKDDSGRTPLHRAALLGHKAVVELLLANKADVTAKDNYGRTPLAVAAIGGYKDVVELLRQHAAQTATNVAATATPATTNAAAKAATKPATPTDTTPQKAVMPADSKQVKKPVKDAPAVTSGTSNRGRLPLRSLTYTDATELRRERDSQK